MLCYGGKQMLGIGIIFFHALMSAAIWLVDSAFLSFYAEIELAAALWSGASMLRLGVRIFIVGMLMIYSLMRVHQLRRENGYYSDFDNKRRAEDAYYGNNESRLKSERVLYHCQALANYFNMTEEAHDALRVLCYCHDIGKVGVPQDILYKPQLTAEERRIYDQHCEHGARIAAQLEQTSCAAELILYHHEYYNGSGVYGLYGNDIPLGCRIFAVAWAYDCMVHPQKRMSSMVCNEALQELRYYEGTAFDPEVVEAFIKLMSKNRLLAPLGQRDYAYGRN